MKRILIILMLSFALGNICIEAGSTPQKRTHKKSVTTNKTSNKVTKYNLGSRKDPNYIEISEGLKIKEALKEKYGSNVTEVTSDDDYDILSITSEYSDDHSYYFFSKGFKTFYAHSSKSYISERNYDDKKFEHKNDKSFKILNAYKWTYRQKNGDDGYVHLIYDRDEDKYERYLRGDSKFFYSEIMIFDYSSDCNSVQKVKTNCAVIQAKVQVFYTLEKNSRERGEKDFYLDEQIKKMKELYY